MQSMTYIVCFHEANVSQSPIIIIFIIMNSGCLYSNVSSMGAPSLFMTITASDDSPAINIDTAGDVLESRIQEVVKALSSSKH